MSPSLARVVVLVLAGLVAAPAALAHPEQGRDEHRHQEREDHPRHPPTVPAGVRVPSWSELAPAQQEKLAPLRESWDAMPASRRVRALERLERRERWDAMTPEQREALRKGVRNFHDLPPELREKMRTSMEAMRALPEDERRRLRAVWRDLNPEQRRAWLEAGGPALSPPPAQP